MPSTRAGHHGDAVYVFEDNGFDSSPSDTTFKVFGSDATLDTYDGSHNAARVFNADRKAAEIVEQLFDGSWSVTFDLSEPPWWLAGVFGQPSSSPISGSLYDHTYSLANDNDPVSLRLYLPTDGFNDYEMLPGCVIASVSIDQSPDGSPEVSISGAYAREPVRQSTPSVSIPSLSNDTYSNRDAEVQTDGNTVGKAQNVSASIEANNELVNEIGSENAVDFTPKTFAPSVTHDKIVWVGQTTDPLQRFKDSSSVSVSVTWDNGETGDAQYAVALDFSGSFPNQWSESGRNDPEADLIEELQEMALDATATVTVDETTPPGV